MIKPDSWIRTQATQHGMIEIVLRIARLEDAEQLAKLHRETVYLT